MDRLISIKELCTWLGVSRQTARIYAERIGARRVIGGSVRYDVGVIKEALANSEYDETGRGGYRWKRS